jgi:uncharacterized protein (TIGR01777 family)
VKIMLAGGSGLIGTALTSELRKNGHEVLRLVRRAPSAPDERGWDPPAGRMDESALAGADAVVNLCGAPIAGGRWSHARRQLLVNSRVEPTEVLAAAVAEQGIPLLVNASAAGYYGDKGDEVVEDTAPRGTGFLADLCQGWETATQRATDAGARVVRLRTGHVLAKRGGLVGMMKPLFFLALGGRLGNGRQYMPWIHVDDQVAAVRHLIEHDTIAGAVNVCSPNPVTNAEFTAEFGRVMRRPAPWFAPAPVLRVAVGDADGEILYSQRMVPTVLAENGFTHGHPSLDETLSSLLS